MRLSVSFSILTASNLEKMPKQHEAINFTVNCEEKSNVFFHCVILKMGSNNCLPLFGNWIKMLQNTHLFAQYPKNIVALDITMLLSGDFVFLRLISTFELGKERVFSACWTLSIRLLYTKPTAKQTDEYSICLHKLVPGKSMHKYKHLKSDTGHTQTYASIYKARKYINGFSVELWFSKSMPSTWAIQSYFATSVIWRKQNTFVQTLVMEAEWQFFLLFQTEKIFF